MNTYLMILLRGVHIVGGALWFGAGVFLMFFVKPAVQSIGASGPQFMQALVERRRAPLLMVVASFLTVLAGAVLYVNASNGFDLALMSAGPGIGFTIGSLAGLIAFFAGNLGIGPTSARMGKLGQEIAASGGPPTAEQIGALHALETRLRRAEVIDFVALTVSVVTMATARYWVF